MKSSVYKNRFSYSFILFISVVCLLGIPFKKWGFKTDDFGNIYHCKIESIQDIPKFFYEGNMEQFNHESNHTQLPQAFFCGLYRPMSFLYYALQYFFFGTSPYCYFLLTIMIHAANAALLFYLFSFWLSFILAFFGAAFFALHPSLWNWLGWISAQTYQIELLIFLLSLIALKKSLDTNKKQYYFISLFLYACNLFLKEQTIVFPFWIIGALYFYKKKDAHSKKENIIKSLKWSLGYWLVALSYTVCRALIFPLTSNTSTLTFEPTWSSFITRQQARFFDFVTYATDLLGLSWLSSGNQLLKGTFLISIIIVISWLFFTSTKKSLMAFCAWSTLILSWPALLMHHQPRYLYLALPCIIAMVLIGITSYHHKTYFYYAAHSGSILAMIMLFLQSGFLLTRFKQREEVLFHITHSFEKLVQNEQIKHNPVCFVNLPTQWFAMGNAQAIWLLTENNAYPVYHFGGNIHLKNRETYLQSPIFDHNPISISKTDKGFFIESEDCNTVWFNHDTQNQAHVELIIPEQYQQQKPIYVTWDYQKGEFKIL